LLNDLVVLKSELREQEASDPEDTNRVAFRIGAIL